MLAPLICHAVGYEKQPRVSLQDKFGASGRWPISKARPNAPVCANANLNLCIREADFVLMVCTETYLKRLQLEEEEGKGLGGHPYT